MALIKCSECGNEISDKAERCIHCGCPIVRENVVLEKKEPETIPNNDGTPNNENLAMAIVALVLSFLGPLALGGLILGIMTIKNNKNRMNASKILGIVAVSISGIVLLISIYLIIIVWVTYYYYSLYYINF